MFQIERGDEEIDIHIAGQAQICGLHEIDKPEKTQTMRAISMAEIMQEYSGEDYWTKVTMQQLTKEGLHVQHTIENSAAKKYI